MNLEIPSSSDNRKTLRQKFDDILSDMGRNVSTAYNENHLTYDIVYAAYMLKDVITSKQSVYNVMSFGAVGDGVTDDTASIQSALNTAGPLGAKVFIPKPSVRYKITSALTILQWHGMTIEGDGWETTEIRQHSSNVPIIQFTKDLTHSITIQGLRLTYATNQNFTSHPQSVAIARHNQDGVSTLNGIFHLAFRDLKIIGATFGFRIIRSFAGDTTSVNGWWGSEWTRILMTNIARSAIELNIGNAGAPGNRFDQIKVMMSASFPNDGLAACFWLKGEAIMSAIDVEIWHNRVLEISSAGVVSIRGLHIEHHHVDDNTGGNRLLYIANCAADIEGLVVGYDSADGFSRYVVFADVSSNVSVRGAILNTPSNGAVYLFSGGAAGTAQVSARGINVTGFGAGVSLWVNGSTYIGNIVSIEGKPPVLQSGDALPTASATYRHRQYITPGNGTSTADNLVQCMLAAAGTYSWAVVKSG